MKKNLIYFAAGVVLALGCLYLIASTKSDCTGTDVARHCVEN